MEDPRRPWGHTGIVSVIRSACDNRSCEGRRSSKVEDLDAVPYPHDSPNVGVCSAQVRGGRNGRSEVGPERQDLTGDADTWSHGRSLRPLVVALIPGQQLSLDKLKRMREAVSNELAETINEYGPKMFDDFDEVRIDLVHMFCVLKAFLRSGVSSFPPRVSLRRQDSQVFGVERVPRAVWMLRVTSSSTLW